MTVSIQSVSSRDLRFELEGGAGSDAIHSEPQYSYAVTCLDTGKHQGTGLAFTLGGGNDWVCAAAEALAQPLVGRDIEEIMADFGPLMRKMADHHQLRWLGPHKGVIHLALASVTNACFDLWAKSRGVPLWRLLLDLSPEALLATLDLSYLEDALTAEDVLTLLRGQEPTRGEREGVIERGYPGYDTSVGWFHYPDEEVRRRAGEAVAAGFDALKLKVGSIEPERDVRRAALIRDTVGDDVRLMVDVNQQWTVPQAIDMCQRLAPMNPFWVEEIGRAHV